jgi:CRISPR-associated protein Csm5
MKAILNTLTPVHIGSGITYNKGIDFIEKDGKIGIIDTEKILEIIGTGMIPEWVSRIENYVPGHKDTGQALLDLLKSRTGANLQPERISSRICTLISINNRSYTLKEQYHTAILGPCIPGSSLKGALKTALLNDAVLLEDFTFERWDIQNGENIDTKVFGDNANEKSTRFLKIGDIQFKDIPTEVHEIRLLNIVGDCWQFKPGQHFLAETIPAGATAGFRMKLDSQLLNRNIEKNARKWDEQKVYFLIDGITEFCETINCTTKELIDWEIDELDNQEMPEEGYEMLEEYHKLRNQINNLEDNEFIIRIGGNSGWKFTTAGWWRNFHDDIPSELWNNLRKKIQRRDYGDMEIWPKTRKITSSGNLLGFVKITLQNG